MNLVIVESPTKAKTISRFLGSDYKVETSFGHIRDLPKSQMGVDIENDFEPKYIIPTKNRKTVTNLKKLADKAERIVLASDEDREGEAISWHLIKALGLEQSKAIIERIAFHEITKEAILEALANPRDLNLNMVDAQQARRVLDRLVGYELSPFLWKKVAKGLSAGRVQSVAVRLVVEREREITSFKPEEYWTIEAALLTAKEEKLTARLNRIDGKTVEKFAITDEATAKKILDELGGAVYAVTDLKQQVAKRSAPTPFITSSLQQTANRWLGFSAKQTMVLAQQLYEGVSIEDNGQVGLITYMRTDSYNLADKFIEEARSYLKQTLGEKYSLATPRHFRKKAKGAQEAHEAIRPTDPARHPDSIKDSLSPGQYKLYKLIWQRALGSQMPDAQLLSSEINIDAKNNDKVKYQFRATGQVIKFDGYLKIYPEKSAELDLPEVKTAQLLDLEELIKEQHFTKPPARYSDAGLVKTLERYGIGRPSTYAPTIATIEARNYVRRDEAKKLAPTDIAFTVIDLLVAHFPEIVDFDFTAKMENNLDEIADGSKKWQPVISEFYGPFHKNLESKYEEIKKSDIMPEITTEEICDKCGSPMIVKTGRYGKFLACSNFPTCRNIKSFNEATGKAEEKSEKVKELEEKYKDDICDKCGSPMVIKNGRFGVFLACSAYPKCKNIKNIKENGNSTGITCPVCGAGDIVQKRSRRGAFYACNRYPDCKTSFSSKPTGEKCPDCGSLLLETKDGGVKCSSKSCGYKK
jgi:DNA topoisomerase-1